MRITFKVALVIGLLIAAVVLTLTYVGVQREHALLHADLKRDARLVARGVGDALHHTSVSPGSVRAIRDAFRDLDAGEAGVTIEVLTSDELATRPGVPDLDPAIDVLEYESPGLVHAVTPLIQDGRIKGAVLVSESKTVLERFARRSLKQTLRAVLISLVLSAFLAGVLGRLLVGRRIDELVIVSRQVAAGDLSVRVAPHGGDELESLMSAVNRMIGNLEGAEKQRRTEMERRIAAEMHLRHAERLATVGQLAAGLAHELGTPLNVISGRAALIVARGQGTAASDARVIVEQSDRVTRIVRQLLGFAHRHQPKREFCEPERITRRAADMLAPTFAGAEVGFSLISNLGAKEILADPVQLEQVITNLLTNAAHASQAGQEIEVVLTQSAEEREVTLAVVDHGPGLSDEMKLRVFDPFFTTKPPGEGTGLGLSVVHGIVSDHGGSVRVRDTPGGGATFEVTLPSE